MREMISNGNDLAFSVFYFLTSIAFTENASETRKNIQKAHVAVFHDIWIQATIPSPQYALECLGCKLPFSPYLHSRFRNMHECCQLAAGFTEAFVHGSSGRSKAE